MLSDKLVCMSNQTWNLYADTSFMPDSQTADLWTKQSGSLQALTRFDEAVDKRQYVVQHLRNPPAARLTEVAYPPCATRDMC